MITNQPLVSIVSGYYNRGEFVDESIQSLCDQTYENIEIIIFDDCSTDNTYKKLKVFEEQDSRVRIIRHESNKGFVKGLIDAIATTKGEYIAIHGSGDFSYPTRIEEQVKVLEERPEVGVVGCIVENISFKNDKEEKEIFNFNIDGNCWEILHEKNVFTHGEVIFRRKLYNAVGGYREFFTFAQDYDLWARMSLMCNFYSVNRPLYGRKILEESVSKNPFKSSKQVIMSEIIQQNLDYYKSGEPDLVEKYGENAAFHLKSLKTKNIRYLYDRTLKMYHSSGKKNEQVKDNVRVLLKCSNRKLFNLLLILIFKILPNKLAYKITYQHKFIRLIYNSIYIYP